jgi:peptidyl-prolyl cis-trans isomerase C
MLRTRLVALPVAWALATALSLPLAAQPAPDPIVARVDGQEIHASDLAEAAQALPQDMRGMPPAVVMPMLIDQLVDRKAITLLARQRKFADDPGVLRAVARATDQAMQTALLQKEISPLITDAALKARYDRDFAGKPGETEVHARHILVPDEADAKAAIAEIKAGADFATVAKARSKDPGSADGGDLGFFKQGDMVPEFAAVAFALKPGEISQTPVKSQFGWHVIKVEERRQAPPASFEEQKDLIRQTVIQEGIQGIVKTAKVGLKIEIFNPDGTPKHATDLAEPPPAPVKK